MKQMILMMALFALLLSGCLPPAATWIVSSETGTTGPEPLEETIPAEPPLMETAAPTAAETAPAVSGSVAYIAEDGNLWLVDVTGAGSKPVTRDAAAYSTNNAAVVVMYQTPVWSDDGLYLAFTREVGTPISEGYSFSYALMVYNADSGELRTVQEGQQTVGFAWKPGTHLLAYGVATDPGYFVTRGGVDSSLATGIFAVDVDSGSTAELVRPEAGFTLFNPQWSPNGQILSFEEIMYMEGRGLFAYYDFQEGQFVRWEKPIGAVDWSLDGGKLLHDNLTYSPQYNERIFEINRDQSGERQLSADVPDGYAYNPLYSPDGSQIAYLSVQGMEENARVSLMVQNLADGQERELAVFSQAYFLSWMPDGQHLLLSTGNYPDLQVVLIQTAEGWQKPLANGWQAAMQP